MRKSKSKAKAGDAAVEMRGKSAAIRLEIDGDCDGGYDGGGGVAAETATEGGFGGKRGREEVGVGDKKRGLFTHESTPSKWTDEKHSLYLKSMEASFVQQLYSSIESSGLQSHRKQYSHMRSCNQAESNSTGKYKVHQNGCWQRIQVGRVEPRPRQVEERQFLLQNPWIQHFRTKGRENKAVQENAAFEGQAMGGQGRTMYTCGFRNFKEHTSNTQAYQDSSISREFSDQNFDDKDCGGGGGQVG